MHISWEAVLNFYLFLVGSFSLFWLVQLKTQNANFVDACWALGVFLASLALLFNNLYFNETRGFLLCLVCGIWALRLALHLFKSRVFSGEDEDRRYRKLRQRWGPRAPLFFFILFQIQAILVCLCAIPFLAVATNKAEISTSDLAACVVGVCAIWGEHIADAQLKAFKNTDGSKEVSVCNVGLWKYSRHPNYFFEWVYWWAYVLFSVGSPYFLLSFFGPALMLWLLWRVTGIKPSEKLSLEKRKDVYRRYQEETSAFFPWFPRRKG